MGGPLAADLRPLSGPAAVFGRGPSEGCLPSPGAAFPLRGLPFLSGDCLSSPGEAFLSE